VSGTGEASVERISLLNEQGAPVELVNVGQTVQLEIIVRAREDLPELVLGYMIKDRLGQAMFGTNTHHMRQVLHRVRSGDRSSFVFRFEAALGPGTYSVATALHTSDNHMENNYEWRDLALVFNVVNLDKTYFIGSAWLPPRLVQPSPASDIDEGAPGPGAQA
jgi:lipopolysaccharide transport system ATP-binding protein